MDAESLTGAMRLYERAGMRVAREFLRWEKGLRPGIDPSTRVLADRACAAATALTGRQRLAIVPLRGTATRRIRLAA